MSEIETIVPVGQPRLVVPLRPIICGWEGRQGKCLFAATWEVLLYEGEEDQTWTPFCGNHIGLARFHGWKIRSLRHNEKAMAAERKEGA